MLLAALAPLLVWLLLDQTTVAAATPARKALGEAALSRMLRLGQTDGTGLRSVLETRPNLRPALAAAIRLQHSAQEAAKARQTAKAANTAATTKKPTITLSMDFSKNFIKT